VIYTLDKDDLVGTGLVVADRAVLVDRYSYALYLKYKDKWKFSFSIGNIYRIGNKHKILFYRELLGLLDDARKVWFINGDKFDYRIVNLAIHDKGVLFRFDTQIID
jgi:hypothetical protein